jgi:hypothetical protein
MNREEFHARAMLAAMQGLLSNPSSGYPPDLDYISGSALGYATQLTSEREKSRPKAEMSQHNLEKISCDKAPKVTRERLGGWWMLVPSEATRRHPDVCPHFQELCRLLGLEETHE